MNNEKVTLPIHVGKRLAHDLPPELTKQFFTRTIQPRSGLVKAVCEAIDAMDGAASRNEILAYVYKKTGHIVEKKRLRGIICYLQGHRNSGRVLKSTREQGELIYYFSSLSKKESK